MIIYKDKFPLWNIKEKNYKHDLTAVICKYENSQRLTWPVSEIVIKLNPDCIFCYVAPGVSCPQCRAISSLFPARSLFPHSRSQEPWILQAHSTWLLLPFTTLAKLRAERWG